MNRTGGAGKARSGRAGGDAVGRSVRRTASALLAAAALGVPSVAGAQQEGLGLDAERALEPSSVNLGVFLGALTPLNDLTSDPGSFGTSVAVSPVFGASAALWPGSGPLGIGLQGFFAPGELQVQATEFQGAIPEDLGNANAFVGTATLLYRLQLTGAQGRVEPFFGIGAGLRRLAVDPIAEPEVEDSTDPLGTIAAGAEVWFARRLGIRFEVRDHLLSFESPTTRESRLQNDISITVGLSTRIR